MRSLLHEKQLLSDEQQYTDPQTVAHWKAAFRNQRPQTAALEHELEVPLTSGRE